MIRLTTKEGNILYLPKLNADDALTIQAQCGHKISMFSDCRDCELEAIQLQCAEIIRRSYVPAR